MIYEDAKFYRKDWMTDDQWECAKFMRDLFFGFHHINGEIKQSGLGIVVNVFNGNWAASFDYDGLTRAVVMAHDRMIRFEISGNTGPNMLKLFAHKRHIREGPMHKRHPTLEDAVARIRAQA